MEADIQHGQRTSAQGSPLCSSCECSYSQRLRAGLLQATCEHKDAEHSPAATEMQRGCWVECAAGEQLVWLLQWYMLTLTALAGWPWR